MSPANSEINPSAARKNTQRRVVDADAHIDPPHEMWRKYLPAHFRELAPCIEEGDEHDWIVFEGYQAARENDQQPSRPRRQELQDVWQTLGNASGMATRSPSGRHEH